SFFLSRIDTEVDKQLEAKIAAGRKELEPLLGKAAIAQAKLAYGRFEEIFWSERFKKLEAKGARVPRPLWASTSTKNPLYPDLLYVETLVGPHTVNTLPPKTLAALVDHGKIAAGTVKTDLAGTHETLEDLEKAGISLGDITDALTVAGVKSFADSYDMMLEAIATKKKQFAGAGA
ncbi:MAG: transaldolase family protein, partial [Candidatus Baltobacteraceae bacterium]